MPPKLLVELAKADPERWREVFLLAGAKAARGTRYAAWSLGGAICARSPAAKIPHSSVSENGWWAALMAGQLLVDTWY